MKEEDRQKRDQHISDQLGTAHLFLKAYAEQGYDTSEVEKILEEAKSLIDKGDHDCALKFIAHSRALMRAGLPKRPDYNYVEPSTLEEIKAVLPRQVRTFPVDWSKYEDKVMGAWLGKAIGGALGGPIEGWPRERILSTYGEITDYVKKPPDPLNDDPAYEIVGLHALEEYGPQLDATKLALEWLEHLPGGCTAEGVALENLKRGIMPPESGIIDNPFSEWIGAQMKGELWGLIAPGNPELALEYAYMDGIIAHEKNGVYGEIYDAVMISLAFSESDIRKIIETALEYVPPNSRFAEVVRESIKICDEAKDWQEACKAVEERWGKEYHLVHTFPNIAAVIVALLFGEGDFERSVCISAMCGLDTDCNVGQVGALVGAVIGGENIPAKWKDPLDDRFDNYVIGFEDLKTSELTARTCAVGRRIAQGWR